MIVYDMIFAFKDKTSIEYLMRLNHLEQRCLVFNYLSIIILTL